MLVLCIVNESWMNRICVEIHISNRKGHPTGSQNMECRRGLFRIAGEADRIIGIRHTMVKELAATGSSRNWDHIIRQIGMFSYTGLTKEQVCPTFVVFFPFYFPSRQLSPPPRGGGRVVCRVNLLIWPGSYSPPLTAAVVFGTPPPLGLEVGVGDTLPPSSFRSGKTLHRPLSSSRCTPLIFASSRRYLGWCEREGGIGSGGVVEKHLKKKPSGVPGAGNSFGFCTKRGSNRPEGQMGAKLKQPGKGLTVRGREGGNQLYGGQDSWVAFSGHLWISPCSACVCFVFLLIQGKIS